MRKQNDTTVVNSNLKTTEKSRKAELSDSDKKLIAEYAAKAAVLREHADALSAQRREKLEAYEARKAQRAALIAEKKPENHDDIVEIYRNEDKLYVEAESFLPRIKKLQACGAQFVHAAATIVCEHLLSGPYKNAKFGPKTKEKFTADSEKLLSALGDFRLYLHFGTRFSGELERYEITISEKNTYNRFCEVVSRYGRKEGEKIFQDPKPPICDTPEKIESFFVGVKDAEEEFQAVLASFDAWRKKYDFLLKLSGEEARFFNVEAAAPKFVFENK